jgi:hypothetical protein
MEHYELAALTPNHLDELRRFIEESEIGKLRVGKFKFGKDRGSFKISGEADFSPLEKTIKSGVKQVTSVTKKVEKTRRKGVGKALKIYRDASGVTRAQLKELQRQNKQLKDELADVRRELQDCLGEKGSSKLTPKSKQVKVQSALSQVEDIANEADEMAALLKETEEANDAVEEAASEAILDSAIESLDELDQAIEDVKDDVDINQNLEETGEMPAEISAIPGAPPAPALTKVVQYTTRDGDTIQGTPQQFASAQVTAAELNAKRKEIIAETSEAIDAIQEERRKETPGGLESALRREVEKRRQAVNTKVHAPSLIDEDMSKTQTRMAFASLMSSLDNDEETPTLYDDEEEEYEREDTPPRTISVVSQKEDGVYW